MVWNLKTRLDTFQVSNSPVPVSTPKSDPTKNWKVYTNTELGLSLKYPPNWGVYNDITIAQFQRTNIISADKVNIQLVVGYYNIDLFEKLYSLKVGEKVIPGYSINKQQITKIESGKIKNNERYVMYQIINENSSAQAPFSAIIFNDPVIRLTLSSYNDYGLETFKQIVKTATLTKSN